MFMGANQLCPIYASKNKKGTCHVRILAIPCNTTESVYSPIRYEMNSHHPLRLLTVRSKDLDRLTCPQRLSQENVF